MLKLIRLTWKSLRNRRVTVGLTVLSIALSVALLLGVERMRRDVQTGFTNTVSGTDLIVGARTGSIQLLLSSVFRIGNAANNLEWDTYEMLSGLPAVDWIIPLSLGDSHRGYRVLGTTGAYYEYLQFGNRQKLRLAKGTWFASDHETVLGAEVARALGYATGDQLVVAHGAGDVSFIEHDEHPFTVSGILERTGTPVDRTIHVDLTGITAIHAGMEAPECDHGHDPLHVCSPGDGAGPSVTAALMGLKTRSAALAVHRAVNEYEKEALSAILPGLVLQELWEMVGVMENVLLAISVLVIAVGLCGMLVALTTSLNERRREMAVLRSVGARPVHILGLIVGESFLVTLAGVLSGFMLLYAGLLFLRPAAAAVLGLHLSMELPTTGEAALGLIIVAAGVLAGLLPAFRSYRYSLADGLTVRL
jgi:putative ABC transport system permease protein